VNPSRAPALRCGINLASCALPWVSYGGRAMRVCARSLRLTLPCSLLLSCALGACSSKPAPKVARTTAANNLDAGADAASKDPRWLAGSVIATVPEGTLGPYVAHGPRGSIALYAPSGAGPRHWMLQAFGASLLPTGQPHEVAPAPDEAPVIVVRPALPKGGFLALWTRRIDHGSALESLALDAFGQRRSDVVTVAEASGPIVWADAVATAGGPIVLWAEQRRERASISCARLDATGQARTTPTTLTATARAWQVAAVPTGAALAYVKASDNNESLGAVTIQWVDGSARAAGPPTAVTESGTSMADLDMAPVGNSLLLAWTDRRDIDNHVFVAAVDRSGQIVTAPRALTPPRGEQSFISLVGPFAESGTSAVVVYEDLAQRAPRQRAVRLTTLDASGVPGPLTARLEFGASDRDMPEVVAAPDGYVALTMMAACSSPATCPGAQPIPAFVRFAPNLSVLGSGLLLIDQLGGQPPSNAWALGCSEHDCSALVTGFASPAPIVAVPLKSGRTTASVLSLERSPMAPHLVTNQVISSLQPRLSKLTAAQVGDNTLVGWVTYYVEPPAQSASADSRAAGKQPARSEVPDARSAPGDPRKPTAASLSVIALDSAGKTNGAPTAISVRAMSTGGVSIAAGGAGSAKEALVAWVARDNADPQVFVTRVGADGKRLGQQMLTRAKGDAADTAAAWVGDGWVVAWVDWRDGNGEVYAAKVDRMLRTIVPETRLTQAPGDASDVSLLLYGKELFVAYSDARDHPQEGLADPYVQKINLATLGRAGQETRLELTPLHSRALRLAAAGDVIVAGWLEQPVELRTEARSLIPGPRMVSLDPKTLAMNGRPVSPKGQDLGSPTSFSFTCTDSVCKGLLAAGFSDTLQAQAVVWVPESPSLTIQNVAALSGPPGEDISSTNIGDDVFFVDEGLSGDSRVRRARLQWTSP
jgi:hypothetical protein